MKLANAPLPFINRIRASRLRMVVVLCAALSPLLLEPVLAPNVQHSHGPSQHAHARGSTPHEHGQRHPAHGPRTLYEIALDHQRGHNHPERSPDQEHDPESPENPSLLWTVFAPYAALTAPAPTALPVAAPPFTPAETAVAYLPGRYAASQAIRGPPASLQLQHL